MCPARNLLDQTFRLNINSVVASISVRLQVAFVARQELVRTGALPSFREFVNGIRMIRVTEVSPEPSQPRTAK